MHRFFMEAQKLRDDGLQLYPDDMNHIINVLRLKKGAHIVVCDGEGTDYICEITDIQKNAVDLAVLETVQSDTEPKTKVILYQSLIKHDKMDFVIQKCVELGVHGIVPVATERSVVKVKDNKDKKIERWRKIARSAAMQSGRGVIPQVGEVLPFVQAVQQMKRHSLALMPYELEKETSMGQVLKSCGGGEISIFIGPEGGFSPQEVRACLDNGITPVTLGKRILRTETAGLCALTVILYETGDL